MGQLLSRIEEIQEQYGRILHLAKQVDVSKLAEKLRKEVYRCFITLKPLRYQYKEIGSFPIQYWYENEPRDRVIAIGKWIRIKYWFSKYGSPLDDDYLFFEIIRQRGNEFTKYLRRPIKNVWTELVALTKQLRPYEHIIETYKLEGETKTAKVYFPWLYSSNPQIQIRPMTVQEIRIGTQKNDVVTLITPSKKVELNREEFRLTDIPSLITLEDFLDIVEGLYLKLYGKVEEVKAYNTPILKKMNDLVAPYRIARALK